MERRSAEEADALAEQRKAVALARVRLHEQQMEMTLQASFRQRGEMCHVSVKRVGTGIVEAGTYYDETSVRNDDVWLVRG